MDVLFQYNKNYGNVKKYIYISFYFSDSSIFLFFLPICENRMISNFVIITHQMAHRKAQQKLRLVFHTNFLFTFFFSSLVII